MICPHIINVSLLVGGILSWGLMWPLIDTRKGDWFPDDFPEHSLQGLRGYKVIFKFQSCNRIICLLTS